MGHKGNGVPSTVSVNVSAAVKVFIYENFGVFCFAVAHLGGKRTDRVT